MATQSCALVGLSVFPPDPNAWDSCKSSHSTSAKLRVQVLEAQMLPACAPFYMGLAAGWGVLVSKYVEHSGALRCLHHAASVSAVLSAQ